VLKAVLKAVKFTVRVTGSEDEQRNKYVESSSELLYTLPF